MEDDINLIFTCLEGVLMLIGGIIIWKFLYFLTLTWCLEGWKRVLMKKYHKDISIEELQKKIAEL